eukprot:TRINITY_DN60638_c0_g1_i1.p1 TRINITY_DN60638_c0_g1~~TRINITY_DN60638_c0_g1_i1.p1  ORF type:complete len:387 (-),score=93.24 TRINITY_DN60638_c0_g1_i1:20-1180(-)
MAKGSKVKERDGGAVDGLNLARDTFLSRVEADLSHLKELRRHRGLRASQDGAASGALAACAEQVEELAGLCERCRHSATKAEEVCQAALRRLPSPEELLTGFEATLKGSRDGSLAESALAQALRQLEGRQVVHPHPQAQPEPQQQQPGSEPAQQLQEAQERMYALHSERRSKPRQKQQHMPLQQQPGLHFVELGKERGQAAITAALREALRERMALRLQRTYRGHMMRRNLLRSTAAEALSRLLTRGQQRKLQHGLAQLKLAAAAALHTAATRLTSLTRGWLGRKRARRIALLKLTAEMAERRCRRRLLLGPLLAWFSHVHFLVRWRCRLQATSAASSSRPCERRAAFWRLFPSDGKTAVAQAHLAWTRQGKAMLAWVQIMLIDTG